MFPSCRKLILAGACAVGLAGWMPSVALAHGANGKDVPRVQAGASCNDLTILHGGRGVLRIVGNQGSPPILSTELVSPAETPSYQVTGADAEHRYVFRSRDVDGPVRVQGIALEFRVTFGYGSAVVAETEIRCLVRVAHAAAAATCVGAALPHGGTGTFRILKVPSSSVPIQSTQLLGPPNTPDYTIAGPTPTHTYTVTSKKVDGPAHIDLFARWVRVKMGHGPSSIVANTLVKCTIRIDHGIGATCNDLRIEHGQSGFLLIQNQPGTPPIRGVALAPGVPPVTQSRRIERLPNGIWRYTSLEVDGPERTDSEVVRFRVSQGNLVYPVDCTVDVHHGELGMPVVPGDGPGGTIAQPPMRTLTVTIEPPGGGVVQSNPGGIACSEPPGAANDCEQSYVEGTQVTLTATPDESSDFAGWSGACSGVGPCTVTMNVSREVTAAFRRTYLDVEVLGPGSGVVVSTPPGIACGNFGAAGADDCGQGYRRGTQISLFAFAATGSVFEGWRGFGGPCSGNAPVCTFVLTNDSTVQARFVPAGYERLDVGTVGQGTVAILPPAEYCSTEFGRTVCYYLSGTPVRLQADPAPGWKFRKWKGEACGWSEICDLVMDGPKEAVAVFYPLPDAVPTPTHPGHGK